MPVPSNIYGLASYDRDSCNRRFFIRTVSLRRSSIIMVDRENRIEFGVGKVKFMCVCIDNFRLRYGVYVCVLGGAFE